MANMPTIDEPKQAPACPTCDDGAKDMDPCPGCDRHHCPDCDSCGTSEPEHNDAWDGGFADNH